MWVYVRARTVPYTFTGVCKKLLEGCLGVCYVRLSIEETDFGSVSCFVVRFQYYNLGVELSFTTCKSPSGNNLILLG